MRGRGNLPLAGATHPAPDRGPRTPRRDRPASIVHKLPIMRLSDEYLRGRTVISADGQAIGKVTSLLIDPGAWRIESICIELRKMIADRIGTRRTLFHRGEIEVPMQMVQSVGDAVILSAEVDELREVQPPVTTGPSAHPS